MALGLSCKKVSLDDFIQNYVDQSKLIEDSFFFDKFTKKGEEFLKEESSLINNELKKIEKYKWWIVWSVLIILALLGLIG